MYCNLVTYLLWEQESQFESDIFYMDIRKLEVIARLLQEKHITTEEGFQETYPDPRTEIKFILL